MAASCPLTIWLLVVWASSSIQQTAANACKDKFKIVPDADQHVLRGQNLTLYCTAVQCEPDRTNKMLTFISGPYGFSNKQRDLRPVNPDFLSRPNNCTLILHSTMTESGVFRYDCGSSRSSNTCKRTVRVGDSAVSDITCNITSSQQLRCSCEEGAIDGQDWTVIITHHGKQYDNRRRRKCKRTLNEFPGCGLYTFNVTRKVLMHGFINSTQYLNISLANVEKLAVSNLKAEAWSADSLGVTWSEPIFNLPTSCPKLTPHYWVLYRTMPPSTANNTAPLYLGENVSSYNISDLDPGMVVIVQVYASPNSTLRGPPTTVKTTLPQRPRIAVTTDGTTSMFSKQTNMNTTTDDLVLVAICLGALVFLVAIFLFVYITRRWLKRNEAGFISPPMPTGRIGDSQADLKATSCNHYQFLHEGNTTSEH